MLILSCFFFNDPATTEIYTLSLHDALPISFRGPSAARWRANSNLPLLGQRDLRGADRKSTRLNSSHEWISYAVFCLKKKKIGRKMTTIVSYGIRNEEINVSSSHVPRLCNDC